VVRFHEKPGFPGSAFQHWGKFIFNSFLTLPPNSFYLGTNFR
jgi:hypothetical protein